MFGNRFQSYLLPLYSFLQETPINRLQKRIKNNSAIRIKRGCVLLQPPIIFRVTFCGYLLCKWEETGSSSLYLFRLFLDIFTCLLAIMTWWVFKKSNICSASIPLCSTQKQSAAGRLFLCGFGRKRTPQGFSVRPQESKPQAPLDWLAEQSSELCNAQRVGDPP